MSIEWDLHLRFKGTKFVQKATIEYQSKQVIRIRVQGKQGSLLLQNDYPSIYFTNSKRGVKWKIREGALNAGTTETSQLLIDIFSQLEAHLKKDIKKIFPDENLLFGEENV